MKKGLTILMFLVAAFLVYRHFQTPPSVEIQQVNEIGERFQAAVAQYRQAGHSAALGGIDATSGAGEAIERVEKIRQELETLQTELEEEEALQRADILMERILTFQRQLN